MSVQGDGIILWKLKDILDLLVFSTASINETVWLLNKL